MEQRRQIALRSFLYILDAVVVLLSLLVAYVLHVKLMGVVPLLKSPPKFREYALMAFFATPVWLALVPLFDLQKVFERLWSGTEIAVRLIKHHLVGFVFLVVMLFLTQLTMNRSLVSLFVLCSFCLMYAVRAILTARLRYEWRTGQGQTRLLLVGADSDGMAAFVEQTRAAPMSPRIVGRIGSVSAEEPALDRLAVPHLGDVDRFEAILHSTPADQVLFFAPFAEPMKALDMLTICEAHGVPAGFSIDLFRPGLAVPRVVSRYDHPFISFDVAQRPPGRTAFKHGFDAVAAALGLVVLSPLFVSTALAILVTMGRPIFFIQERAGLFGRRFRMLKFRTMVRDAEAGRGGLEARNEMDGPVFKIADDPRITRLGRFLRRSSIDELPQLLNVLIGTMSLVGPRPLPVDEQQGIYGWHRRRLSVKPGITGLWQVSGRNEVDFQDWMRLDLKYVDSWSLKLDALILLKTIRVVLSRTGAR